MNKECKIGEVKSINPIYNIGFVLNLGGHPMICSNISKNFKSKTQDYIYEFLMCTDERHLKDTNLFDDKCTYKIDVKNWPGNKSIVNLATKFVIHSPDIASNQFWKFEKYPWTNKHTGATINYQFADDILREMNDEREHLEAVGKTITIKLNGDKQPEILECGQKYLETFDKIKTNVNKIDISKNQAEKISLANMTKEINAFLTNQKSKSANHTTNVNLNNIKDR